MILRVFQDGLIHEIEAPEGSVVLSRGDQAEELILFEAMPGGPTVERRFPSTVVLKAARRGSLGLRIVRSRVPWVHPEVAIACPGN